MKILITGVAGFIGFSFANFLCKKYKNVNIIGIDNINSYYSQKYKKKRINELNNATFDDLIQHGYAMTIQDVNRQFLSGSELTMDQFQDVFAV